MLVLCLELLEASAAVSVIEAEFEDMAVEDAAFVDVCATTTGVGEKVAVVQSKFSLASGAVLAWG